MLAATLTGHTDAVWSLSYLGGNHQQLLSASADGTVKLWSPISKSTSNNVGPQQLVKTFGYSPTPGKTCILFSHDFAYNRTEPTS